MNQEDKIVSHVGERVSMSPDDEVAMILSSNIPDGPSSSKRARLLSHNKAGSSLDDDEFHQKSPGRSRSMDLNRPPWDDESSDSSPSPSPVERNPADFELFLSSIPIYTEDELRQIPKYMEILGDDAKKIVTELPKSSLHSKTEMEEFKINFIYKQLQAMIRKRVRRANRKNQTKGPEHLASIKKPLAIRPIPDGYRSE